jgi:hypothetical protein
MEFVINKNKNDILDPLSVIIKLFIYSYKPVGTKISISHNKIFIQENGLLQSVIRSVFGDSKNDINIIYFPIIFACKFYLSDEKKKKYLSLFNKTLDSFDILKETYQGNEIIYNIDQLKNIIVSFIDNNDFNPNTILPNYDSAGNKIKQDIYKHINSIWTGRRINIIFSYIDEILESSSSELTNNLINSLTIYMNCVDIITFNLITNL